VKLKLLYFAQLRETLGLHQEELECQVSTVQSLIDLLAMRSDLWHRELASEQPLKVAVDQQMVSPAFELRCGAEVALFRPVTGG